jgi:hypothetical protein
LLLRSLRADTIDEPAGVGACHCRECQRRTGAPFGVTVAFLNEQVRIKEPSKEYVWDAQEGRKVRFRVAFRSELAGSNQPFGPKVGWVWKNLQPDRRSSSISSRRMPCTAIKKNGIHREFLNRRPTQAQLRRALPTARIVLRSVYVRVLVLYNSCCH